MDQYRLAWILLCIALPVIGIEFIFYRFTKIRFLIYVIPLIALLTTLIFLYIAYFIPLEGMADLGFIVMAMLSGGVFLIGIIFALVFDGLKRRRMKS